LLQGGRIVDPSSDMDQAGDVLIQDGKIAGARSWPTPPREAAS